MRIESSQADMRASKAAMGADLNITGEVCKSLLTKVIEGELKLCTGYWCPYQQGVTGADAQS